MKDAKIIEKKFLNAYDRYADDIFRHCLYRLGYDRELAKEMMQEVFTKVWHYLAIEGKDVQYIKAFLYRTATNMVIDYIRKKKEASLEMMQENGFEPVDKGVKKLENKVDAILVQEVIDSMNEDDREVIVMRYVNDLKPKEIAVILELSVNVVSVRITRAKKRLRKILKNK